MDLKIRLSEALNSRLRTHAENTGATLNSIICLAIDSFLPGGVQLEKPTVEAPAPEPVAVEKRVIVASQKPVPPKPKLSSKPTKGDRDKLAAWHRAYGAGQRDLLEKS